MAHTLQSETTPRGKQILAAITLGHLLETDPLAGLAGAPVPDWRIDALGRIHGHVPSHSEHKARRAIDEYANFLGADLRCEPNHDARSEWLNLSTSGTYRGVPVNVWTHVAIRVTNPYGSTR